MEITVGAAATPPTLTSKDSSPGGTSGISTFICSRPSIKPGARPANWRSAGTPPILTCTEARGTGNGGLDGATSPVVTGGSTNPLPVRYAVTYSPGRAGVCAALRVPSARVRARTWLLCGWVKTPGPVAATSKLTAELNTPLDWTINLAVPTLVS